MLILNHFAEKFDPVSCKGTCDNCASTDEVIDVDLTTHADLFVKMIKELENRCLKITGPQSMNAFRGTTKKDMVRKKFDTLENFSKGSDCPAELVKRLLDHLVAREILTTELEEAHDPIRPPISYVYVLTFFFTFVKLRLTKEALAARTQGEGVPCEQTILYLEDSFRKNRRSRSEV
jgi:superfamily II DNA helicase RecQ